MRRTSRAASARSASLITAKSRSRRTSTSLQAAGTGAVSAGGGRPWSPGAGGTPTRGTTSVAASGSSTASGFLSSAVPNVASKAAMKRSRSERWLQSAARRAKKDSSRFDASTAASARCAVTRSPTPTRAPPARIDATSRASLSVTKLDIRQHPRRCDAVDVLPHLEGHAQRSLEIGTLECDERPRPVDRLAHARQLVELLAAQPLYRGADALRYRLGHARDARPHDLGLPLARGVVDPVVEAATLEGVVQLARAVGGQDHERPRAGHHRAELGDRDLEVRQELEQEGLELVVGAIDLVDQQHYRAVVLERLEQRAAQQELS